jgi:glycosyltransferase involved in cell wall biosynthesis
MGAGEMASVSVILPCCNRLRYLKPAVESVFAQSFSDWELIIADDGSGEETRRYLAGLGSARVKIVSLPHSGNPSRVRNAALSAATGRYVAFLDSDDVWTGEKLALQLAALKGHPEARWCYTGCAPIDAEGRPLQRAGRHKIERPQGWIFAQLLTLEIGIAMPTVLAERSLVEEAGGFDEQQRFGEFHDLCLRLSLKGTVVALDEELSQVRWHDEHYSADRVGDQAGWMRLYEKMSQLAPTPSLVRHCRRMRAVTAVKLARELMASRDPRSALTTLARSLPFSWQQPSFWWSLCKAASRMIRPQRGALRS